MSTTKHHISKTKNHIGFFYKALLWVFVLILGCGISLPTVTNVGDLAARQKQKELNSSFYTAILKTEARQEASGISAHNGTEQYEAYYNTSSAYFLGEKYMDMVGIMYLAEALRATSDMAGRAFGEAFNAPRRLSTLKKAAYSEQLRTKYKVNVSENNGTFEGANLAETGSKLVKQVNLGKYVGKKGAYEIYEDGEVFYRSISKDHFDVLIKTNRMPKTGECTTSPNKAFLKIIPGI